MKHNVIGLTGQTGAGKSTVADYAESLGCQVIHADAVAREALAKGSPVLKTLADLFGYDIIETDGSCKRSLLAERAFSSPEKTALLNRTTHPWILARVRELIARCDPCRPVLFDAPQLYESGGEVLCGRVIAVTAPQEVRLDRIMRRDGMTEQAARLRMGAQHQESYYTDRADYIIDGSQPLDRVREAAARILREIEDGGSV